MAVKLLTYLDLTPEQRKKAAQTARGQLQAAASNPFLVAGQRSMVVGQMQRLSQWEQGTLPLGPSPKKS